jgi:hypothetical protein
LTPWSNHRLAPTPIEFDSEKAACTNFNVQLVFATLVPILAELQETGHNITIDDTGDWGRWTYTVKKGGPVLTTLVDQRKQHRLVSRT